MQDHIMRSQAQCSLGRAGGADLQSFVMVAEVLDRLFGIDLFGAIRPGKGVGGKGAEFLEVVSLLDSLSQFVQDVSGIERLYFYFRRLRPSYLLISLHLAIIEQGQLIDSLAASGGTAIHDLLLLILKNKPLEGYIPLHLIIDGIEMDRLKDLVGLLPDLGPEAYLVPHSRQLLFAGLHPAIYLAFDQHFLERRSVVEKPPLDGVLTAHWDIRITIILHHLDL